MICWLSCMRAMMIGDENWLVGDGYLLMMIVVDDDIGW